MIPFTGSNLDRASHRRCDGEWIAAQLRHPRTLIHPMWRLQPFAIGAEGDALEPAFVAPGLCEELAGQGSPCVFLGLDHDRAVFAFDISPAEAPETNGPLAGLGRFHELRGSAARYRDADLAMLGQAKALIDWHQRHGFCPRCGLPTQLMDAGYRRLCTNCGAEHFPRTDPVVIMLATRDESCLVGRGRQFPGIMYSALAGFIEPGETIEEAVRREIFEEAGIRIGHVRYFTSQPWPFPSSLMIGCFAEALDSVIRIDETELADARWVDRATARALLAGEAIDGIRLPPRIAIAHHLVKAWVEGA